MPSSASCRSASSQAASAVGPNALIRFSPLRPDTTHVVPLGPENAASPTLQPDRRRRIRAVSEGVGSSIVHGPIVTIIEWLPTYLGIGTLHKTLSRSVVGIARLLR